MTPYYLKDHLTNVKEKKDTVTGILMSSTGSTELEIYYYGDIMKIKKTPYIIDGDFPALIVAKDPLTGETFTVFDGMKHGYDPMFCHKPCEDAERPLKLYEHNSGTVQIAVSYSIDYEEEKEDYDFDAQGNVILTYGSMNWNDAKSIGFDWLSLAFVKSKKEFAEFELA